MTIFVLSLFFSIKVACFRCFIMSILFLVREIFRRMKNYVLTLKYLEPVLFSWTILCIFLFTDTGDE